MASWASGESSRRGSVCLLVTPTATSGLLRQWLPLSRLLLLLPLRQVSVVVSHSAAAVTHADWGQECR